MLNDSKSNIDHYPLSSPDKWSSNFWYRHGRSWTCASRRAAEDKNWHLSKCSLVEDSRDRGTASLSHEEWDDIWARICKCCNCLFYGIRWRRSVFFFRPIWNQLIKFDWIMIIVLCLGLPSQEAKRMPTCPWGSRRLTRQSSRSAVAEKPNPSSGNSRKRRKSESWSRSRWRICRGRNC